MGAVGRLDDVLGRVALFTGRAVRAGPIEGGLSHHIWRVDCDEDRYVLRVLDPAVSAVGLGIAPELEIANTLRAAASGVGAGVHEVLPDVPAIVLEYLPGHTLHAPDVRSHPMLGRIAAACHRLHAGPRFANDFSIVAKLNELLALCEREGLPVPDGFRQRLPIVEEVCAALAVAPLATVPCHNDLLAENLIDTGDAVRIVDYQLSGNNDPCFELGDIAAESDFDQDLTRALTAAYFGAETSPALVARVRLNLLLSNYTWTLWFAVHHGLLRPAASFDYGAEADDKWSQAVRDADSPDLGGLLADAAHRRPSGLSVLP
jgi:thiamine kinase-like enzyme